MTNTQAHFGGKIKGYDQCSWGDACMSENWIKDITSNQLDF